MSKFFVFDANASFLKAVTLSRSQTFAEYPDENRFSNLKYNVTHKDKNGSAKKVNVTTWEYRLFAKHR